MLVTTNRRLVQLITLVLSFSIVFPSQFAIAAPSSSFQLAIEAKEAKRWKKALSLFSAVSESDPDYGRALDEIALINDLQKGDREAHNTRYKAERLMEKLDKGADKCVGLLKKDGSPEVHGCFDEMSKVESEISDMLKSTNYEHQTLKDLDKQLVPYRKFDEIALPVTKVRPTRDEMEQATERVLALEHYIDDRNNPPNLVALGAFVLSQFHLGGARAHAKDCARLRQDPETKDTQATADICGFAEEASMKYGDFVRRLDSSNLIDGPQIPSITFKAVAPIKSDKVPRPEVVSLLVAAPKADSKIPQDSQGSWTTYLVVGGITGVAAILGTAFLKMGPAKAKQQPTQAEPPAASNVVTPQSTVTTTVSQQQQPAPVVKQDVLQPQAPVSVQVDESKVLGSSNAVTGQQAESGTGSPLQSRKLADLKKRIAELNLNKENAAAMSPESKERGGKGTTDSLLSPVARGETPGVLVEKHVAAPPVTRSQVNVPLSTKNPVGSFQLALNRWKAREPGSFQSLVKIAREIGVVIVKDNVHAKTYALTPTYEKVPDEIATQIYDLAMAARMLPDGVVK